MSLFRRHLPKAKDMLQVKNDRSALRVSVLVKLNKVTDKLIRYFMSKSDMTTLLSML